MVVDTYQETNSSLRLTTGWTANDTFADSFVQSGTVAQTATLDFEGIAVWVWGFCGPRGQYFGGDYGAITVDGASSV